MSFAYYIVLDIDQPGFDTFVNGKAIAHALVELDALCNSAKLPSLDSFIGQPIADFEEFMEEDFDLPAGDDGEAKWFKPSEGITYFAAIITAIEKNPDSIDDADAVLLELQEYIVVLRQAQHINAGWHLALDI